MALLLFSGQNLEIVLSHLFSSQKYALKVSTKTKVNQSFAGRVIHGTFFILPKRWFQNFEKLRLFFFTTQSISILSIRSKKISVHLFSLQCTNFIIIFEFPL